jgi:hypothetical protein
MSHAEASEAKGGRSPALLLAQKLIIAAAFLAFFAAFFWMAQQMPARRAAGDVGSAFLPLIVAGIGTALTLIYLVQILMGRDRAHALAHPMALGLLALTLLTVGAMYWLGMPIALGLGAALMVIVLERGQRPLWAVGTGLVFWALTQFGFGMLLGVPLM